MMWAGRDLRQEQDLRLLSSGRREGVKGRDPGVAAALPETCLERGQRQTCAGARAPGLFASYGLSLKIF